MYVLEIKLSIYLMYCKLLEYILRNNSPYEIAKVQSWKGVKRCESRSLRSSHPVVMGKGGKQ